MCFNILTFGVKNSTEVWVCASSNEIIFNGDVGDATGAASLVNADVEEVFPVVGASQDVARNSLRATPSLLLAA